MYKVFLRVILFVSVLTQSVNSAQAQNGDQILDGIGETGMIARYVFNGDLRDWSRNNLHAKYQGAEATFVADARFGRVLSLSGDNNAFVTIPGDALTDLESLSISGWVYLRSKQPGQRFFDFGKDAAKRFFAAPVGTSSQEGYQALITAEKGNKKGAVSPAIDTNKWVHLAIVIDVPSKSIITYVDSKQVGEARDIPRELTEVFGQQGGDKKLYIGKSLVAGDPNLNALIHDFRIYRIPLSGGQVAGIYNNAVKGRGVNEGTVNTTRRRVEDTLPRFSPTEAQLYTTYLIQVADVQVETEVGNLPRLPSYVQGTYKNELKGKGPKVRVVWPADTNNTAVLKPGSYTVTGRVAGTNFSPKAVVTVKASKKSSSPVLKLAAFDLGKVTLKTDAQGQETKFVENRDKFISTLATTDPNSFLYMFRHAFGQKQPAGA
ncbi:MAG TPA: LamG-like jellyroll fold domain-containing protein, partial [Chitinophagaceae bacterium]|nr:LamG-like jellyroll fold domain-containing protein [Chitinophagaceae bacterium]